MSPMMPYRRTVTFIPLRIAVLTVSDTRDEKTDKSGDALASMVGQAGHEFAARAIVTDDAKKIRKHVKNGSRTRRSTW